MVTEQQTRFQDGRMAIQEYVVDLEQQPGEQVTVMSTLPQPGVELRPLLWVPGYGDGCDNKLPLAYAMAECGIALRVIGQNRANLLPDPKSGHPDGIGTVANTQIDAMTAMGWHEQTLPMVGYSNGGQVAAKMVELATRNGWKTFAEAPVVLLGPTGVSRRDTIATFTMRGLFEILDENCRPKVSNPDHLLDRFSKPGNDLVEVIKVMLANFPRAVSEYEGLMRRIKLAALAQKVGWLSVGVFPHDNIVKAGHVGEVMEPLLLPDEQSDHGLELPSNISFFSAYFNALRDQRGKPVGRRGLFHMTPFKFPRGTAEMVAQQIREHSVAAQTN